MPTMQVLDLKSNCYSQTGCSFASNIAILRCNVAILMYKLLGANCNRFDKLLSKRLQCFENIFGQFILPNNLLKNNECNLIF